MSSLARPVREYLDALDAAVEPTTPPKNVPLTDPVARWTAAPGGPAFYAYPTTYLIDVKAGVIVDVEATPAYRTDEVDSTRTMVDRVEQCFDLKPKHPIGDTAYGTAEMWLVPKGFELSGCQSTRGRVSLIFEPLRSGPRSGLTRRWRAWLRTPVPVCGRLPPLQNAELHRALLLID